MRSAISYLRDSKEMLILLEDFKKQYPVLPEGFAWLLIDYDKMYPSMPHELAGEACREYLDTRTWMVPSTDNAMDLLKVVQENNIFEFGNQLRVQKTGTSIGQKQAPPYACLGAAKLEEDLIYPHENFQNMS